MTTNAPPAITNAAAAEGLRDIVGPLRIIPLRDWLLYGGLAALILGLAALAWYLWWRARQRRLSQPAPPPPLVPPEVRARRQLEEALRYLSEPDRFCTEVSRVLRVYLEERFGWNAPDRTTEEFLAQLHAQGGLAPEHQGLLQDFLGRCDLVKFARHDPTESELLELHGAAVRLVEDTAPPAPRPHAEAPHSAAPTSSTTPP
ncbi:MAG: hypothetical protein JNK85_01360 [Verrucomicrobiales bacterium]|nr:hypothetical protein [Verrucomicrobiales bacterium]